MEDKHAKKEDFEKLIWQKEFGVSPSQTKEHWYWTKKADPKAGPSFYSRETEDQK
jgi:hypothetical protein